MKKRIMYKLIIVILAVSMLGLNLSCQFEEKEAYETRLEELQQQLSVAYETNRFCEDQVQQQNQRLGSLLEENNNLRQLVVPEIRINSDPTNIIEDEDGWWKFRIIVSNLDNTIANVYCDGVWMLGYNDDVLLQTGKLNFPHIIQAGIAVKQVIEISSLLNINKVIFVFELRTIADMEFIKIKEVEVTKL